MFFLRGEAPPNNPQRFSGCVEASRDAKALEMSDFLDGMFRQCEGGVVQSENE